MKRKILITNYKLRITKNRGRDLMSQKNTFLKIIVPVIVVAAGAAVMMGLSSSRTEPKKEIKKVLGVLVRTV